MLAYYRKDALWNVNEKCSESLNKPCGNRNGGTISSSVRVDATLKWKPSLRSKYGNWQPPMSVKNVQHCATNLAKLTAQHGMQRNVQPPSVREGISKES